MINNEHGQILLVGKRALESDRLYVGVFEFLSVGVLECWSVGVWEFGSAITVLESMLPNAT